MPPQKYKHRQTTTTECNYMQRTLTTITNKKQPLWS